MDQLQRRARSEVRKRRQRRELPGEAAGLTADPRRLLHELQVHQVELEMQNASLQEARNQTEALLGKYANLYDFAPVGYFSLDDQLRIVESNLTGASLLGLERSRLLRQPLCRFVSPDSRAPVLAFLKRVLAGIRSECCEAALLKADGEIVWAGLHGTPAPAAGEPPQRCWLAVSDLTILKAANDKLRNSELRYRRLFEAAHDGVLLLDPETRQITDANPFMAKLLGCSRAEMIGRELHEIGLLKDEVASRRAFRKLNRRHEVRYDDLPLRSRNGARREVEVVATLYREDGHSVIQCNVRDITERRRVEAAERRLALVTASNARLEKEIVRRRAVEESLRQSRRRQGRLLVQAHEMQDQLRQLSRDVLRVQEEERRSLSRELHDVIAQMLTGINLQLGTLKQHDLPSGSRLARRVTATQRLVTQSMERVHQFARDLRPAMLDDLGIIPALHAHLKSFAARTGIHARLTAGPEVEQLDATGRTVLFRVAQEALTNVARHARAQRVEVSLRREPGGVCLRVMDDGRSFRLERVRRATPGRHLGLLGMRERLEMVGGRLDIVPVADGGTTIVARVPLSPKPATSPAPRKRKPGA